MRILINVTNLCGGGGVQVADSICRQLENFRRHEFIIVYSDAMKKTILSIESSSNISCINYNYPAKDLKSLIFLRNTFLDTIVDNEKIDCVFTIFGPMKWRPKVTHLSGFALAHIIMSDSPFFTQMNHKDKLKWKLQIKLWEFIFKRSSDNLYTENRLITDILQKKFKRKKIYTVTNYYNQIFDKPQRWKYHNLPEFDGAQFLDIANAGPHKNLKISIDIARHLKKTHPEFKFRFVFTIDKEQFPPFEESLQPNFLFTGRVKIDECPSLYEQCDISFQPTLLECFTATYPEAMRMKRPIVTTSLDFAKGICGDAALYYSPLDYKEAAEKLYLVSTNPTIQEELVNKGLIQLKKFDTYESRVSKLISICEEITNKYNHEHI